MSCKIDDIKRGMMEFIAPGKDIYDKLVEKGLIDNDKLTQYIRTGLKAKKADAINARFDDVLKWYEPEVQTEESKQLVKDAEEFVKETKARDAKPETEQKKQSTSSLKAGDKVVNSKGIEYEIVSIDNKGNAEIKYTSGKAKGKLGVATNVKNLNKLPSVKPTKELKLDDTKLKAGEDLPNQELTEAQVKAIEARNEAYLKANPDVKVVESNTYWWDNSAIQVVEGDTRANRAVYLAHELYHDKTAEWLRQNQEDPDVKKLQRLMDMVRDRLRKDIYSNNSDTVELLNERLRWDSGQKELGLLQENTAILLAEPNVQKALEEYVGKDRRNIVQKVMDKLKEYMFKTSEDRVNYDEIMKMVKKIERKSTKLAPVSTETMLETASPMELIEMAEQKKKC